MDVYEFSGVHLWDLLAFLKDRRLNGTNTIYRGQKDADWKITPALFRTPTPTHIQDKEKYFLNAEMKMINAFFEKAELMLRNYPRSTILDRVIAQHYFAPTQLLDWSNDPLVAIFFAAQRYEEKEFAIFALETFSTFPANSELVFPIKQNVSKIRPPIIDDRVKYQKSIFTIHSFGGGADFVPLDEREAVSFESSEGWGGDAFKLAKVLVPKKARAQMRLDLIGIGMDHSIAFPGLQGVGETIADLAEHYNLTRFH